MISSRPLWGSTHQLHSSILRFQCPEHCGTIT